MTEEDTLADELLDELEEDNDWKNMRERRIEELKKEALKQKLNKDSEAGRYIEIKEEKEFLKITTTVSRVVCHFSHDQFTRCRLLDEHLASLAPKHPDVKFVKMNVEKSPFFVEKLKVQVLPCIIVFIDGITVERLIGFEEFGGSDSFTSGQLEKRLAQTTIFLKERENKKKKVDSDDEEED